MTKLPWEKDATLEEIEEHRRALADEPDPFMFVRLRISHGDTVKYVGIRADDTDITGEIPLDDGTAIVVRAWGVPTKSEPFMKSSDILKEIQHYVESNGLTLR